MRSLLHMVVMNGLEGSFLHSFFRSIMTVIPRSEQLNDSFAGRRRSSLHVRWSVGARSFADHGRTVDERFVVELLVSQIRGNDAHDLSWIGVTATGPCSSSFASLVAQVTGRGTQRVKTSVPLFPVRYAYLGL